MRPAQAYLKDLMEIRRTGGARAETSYYGPLENLLNEAGAGIKPRVRCVAQVRDTGAGSPDFGLYEASQFAPKSEDPIPGALPSRGVVEVKSAADNSFLTAEGEQVTRYWGKYGQVLVTNYNDFVLVGRDEKGNPEKLETFSIA